LFKLIIVEIKDKIKIKTRSRSIPKQNIKIVYKLKDLRIIVIYFNYKYSHFIIIPKPYLIMLA